MRVSHGCIRLYPEDIATLFEQIKIGTSVNIVYQPFKAGIRKGMLYLEAHDSISDLEASKQGDLTNMVAAIIAATKKSLTEKPLSELGWEAANRIASDRTGVATQVIGLD
jgi:L,D-transpeptidase ErfK/SrfK